MIHFLDSLLELQHSAVHYILVANCRSFYWLAVEECLTVAGCVILRERCGRRISIALLLRFLALLEMTKL